MGSFRRDYITRPIFAWAKKAMPAMSDTEREALEAGDVWWDADLFSGNPDWAKLLAIPQATLTAEEQAFLEGPVDELCAMLDDWKISWELRDLPPEVWDFIKRHGFFGMIIPKEFGGLGFSPYAHSEVVRKVSTRSLTAAVTVMVPNSLGPGELLMRFGTEEQQQQWLPRLADGSEIPVLRPDQPRGRLRCRLDDRHRHRLQGQLRRPRGARPEAQLAQALHHAGAGRDRARPRLQGAAIPTTCSASEEDLGITVALIPTHLPGVEIGRRHLPSMQVFQNGPNWGRDVFIPLDCIIGGGERIGQGWKMLMSALAAGRGISLPSLSAAGAAYCRAHHRRLCAHPRAVQHSDRQVRRHRGAARAHRRHRLPDRRGAPADLRRAGPGP